MLLPPIEISQTAVQIPVPRDNLDFTNRNLDDFCRRLYQLQIIQNPTNLPAFDTKSSKPPNHLQTFFSTTLPDQLRSNSSHKQRKSSKIHSLWFRDLTPSFDKLQMKFGWNRIYPGHSSRNTPSSPACCRHAIFQCLQIVTSSTILRII